MDKQKTEGLRQLNSSPIQETYRAQEATTLEGLLSTKSGRSRTAVKKLLSTGRVSVQGKPAKLPTLAVEVGGMVTVHKNPIPPSLQEPLMKTVWEDEHYVVIDKSPGIYTVNTTGKNREETVIWHLSHHYKKLGIEVKLFMVNRLDRESSGLVVLAKSIKAKDALVSQWHKVVTSQRFVVVAEGKCNGKHLVLEATAAAPTKKEGEKGLLRRRIQRHTTRCEAKVCGSSPAGTMHVIEVEVGSERLFSLRKIFGDNGLVILGDGRYHSNIALKGRIALEQVSLQLTHPITHRKLSFERPYPTAFFGYLKQDVDNRSKDNK